MYAFYSKLSKTFIKHKQYFDGIILLWMIFWSKNIWLFRSITLKTAWPTNKQKHGNMLILILSYRLKCPFYFVNTFFFLLTAFKSNTTDHAVVLLSDDHGKTWRPGGVVPYQEDSKGRPIFTSESSVRSCIADEKIDFISHLKWVLINPLGKCGSYK